MRSSPVCHHARRVSSYRCYCFSNGGSVHPGLDEPGRQAAAFMVRRSQAGDFYPLGRVFCARLRKWVVLVALAGPAATGPEVCWLHVPKLPTRVQLPGVCASVSRSVLQPRGVGGYFQSFWCKVSDCVKVFLVKIFDTHLLWNTHRSVTHIPFCLRIFFIAGMSSWLPNTTKDLRTGSLQTPGTGILLILVLTGT